MKRPLKITLVLLAIALALYALPFVLHGLVNNNTKQFMFEQVKYKPLVDRITKSCTTDSAKAMALFTYVSYHCRQPQGAENPNYNTTYGVYVNKTASCDQQVWLLMALLRVEDIDAEMVFLYGDTNVSRHTVAQVSINNEFVMLDPFYNLHFLSRYDRNNYASLSDLERDTSHFSQRTNLPKNYTRLFKKKYSFKIHSTNSLDGSHRFIRNLVWGYSAVFGRLFVGPLEAMH